MAFCGVANHLLQIGSSSSPAGSISGRTVNSLLADSQVPVPLRLGDQIDMKLMMCPPLKIQHKTRRSRNFQYIGDHKRGISVVYAHVQTSKGSDQCDQKKKNINNSLYHVLGLSFGATREEIKASYRRLARLHHPDAAPPDEKDKYARNFMDIHIAYTTLSNPQSRADYDRLLITSMKFRWRSRSWETDQCW